MRIYTFFASLAFVAATSLFGAEFTSVDINTGQAGSTVHNGLESYTVRGGGADIWNGSDGFRYVYQSYTGDFDIQAKVSSIDPTNPWAKAGVMVRQDTSANSIHAMMVATSANGFAFQYRSVTGQASSSVGGGATGYPFSWVRLIRSGSLIAGYKSIDPIGAEWHFVGSTTLSLTDPVLVGLCVTAHNNSTTCKAEFSNVNVRPFVLPVAGSGTGLSASYFNNKTFAGTPALQRVDPEIDFKWLTGSPDAAISADNFSAHWSGFIEAQYSESYTFHTSSDDGIRVWVDGVLVLDNWTLHSPQANRTFAKTLVAGERYPIVVEFFENGGGAEAKLSWSSRSTFKEIIPQSQLYPDANSTAAGEGDGLKAEYFNSRDFSNYALTRIDPGVNFSWGSTSPAVTVNADNFSARWTGAVEPRHTGLYTFYTTSDDGVRLWVGNQLVINNWTDHGPTENSGVIPLIAGQRYAIRMEYYERSGGAVAKLSWSSAELAKQLIPSSQLYPANGKGLFAEYFDDAELTQPILHRVDKKIDFNWGDASPDASIQPDSFSVRWSGRIEPKYTEAYTFYTETDESVRLWINGQLVIDQWTSHSQTEHASAAIPLFAGQPVEIKMEYAEIAGDASAKLSWASGSQPKQAVPSTQLYPNGGMIVSVPASSPISPAFIEGTMWSPSNTMFEVTAASNEAAVPVTTLGAKRFFVNLPLQAGVGTPVAFSHSETGVGQSGFVTWTTTEVVGANSSSNQILLRVGDALQLTASGTGAAATIDANGDGTADYTGVPGGILPYQYSQPGHYVVNAKIDGALVGELLVTVVDIDWRGQIACIVGYARTKNVAVFPATAATNVAFTSADNSLLNVSLKDLTSTGAALFIRPNDRGTPVVISRLGGMNGPILAYKEIDEYAIDLPALHDAVFDEDTNTGATKLTVRPYIPDIRFELTMFAHLATFENGETVKSVNTSDIDTVTGLPKFQQVFNAATGEIEGVYTINFGMPHNEATYCFRVNAYQTEIPIGAIARSAVTSRVQFTDEQMIEDGTNVNGGACWAKVSKLVLCGGAPPKLMLVPTRPKVGGGVYDMNTYNCFAAIFTESQDTVLEKGFDCKKADNSKKVEATPNGSGLAGVDIAGKNFPDVLAVVQVFISSDKDPACVGQEVTFTATILFANGEDKVTVNWSGGGDPASDTGTTFTTKWENSGTKTVTATISVDGFEDTCSVTYDQKVVKIKEITATPEIVCVGDTITFKATPDGGDFPKDEPTWTFVGPGTPNTTKGSTVIVTTTGPGTIKGTAKCGDSEVVKEAKAVEVWKLQCKRMGGGFEDAPEPLIVCKGDTVEFQALALPEGESFPIRAPKWSGTSGASGDGDTVVVTFNTTSENLGDLKTVIATCGNSVVAKVLVVEIDKIVGPDPACIHYLALYTAIAKPAGASFPSGEPVWTGNVQLVDGNKGTSVVVGFDSLGQKTITAHCGDSITNKNIEVIDCQNINLKLTIYDALDGSAVSEGDVITRGAFAVANINDTDGDKVVDSQDNDVTNEVDLMKVVVEKPIPDHGGNVSLKILTGKAKFWENSNKVSEASLTIPVGDLPKTIWLEATEPSAALRDISIESKYFESSYLVKATAVWAKRTGFRNKEDDVIFAAAGDPLRTTWRDNYHSVLGPRFLVDGLLGEAQYAMCMEFTVSPPDIGNEPRIKFDVTRQIAIRVFDKALNSSEFRSIAGLSQAWPGTNSVNAPEPLGEDVDLANDQPENTNADNDNTPNRNRIYSIDGPGFVYDLVRSEIVYQANFLEFVRVRFDDIEQTMQTSQGSSRCSEKEKWHAFIWAERYTVDGAAQFRAKDGKTNEVDLGHLPIVRPE